MRTTNRIRAAATLVWLGVALANHARAEVRIADGRLSLHTEGLPLRELIASLERSGLARIEVHGDVSGITVSDSFAGTDVAQALRRVLSAHSHVLIDGGGPDSDPRTIELILLSPSSGGPAAPGPESDPLSIGSTPAGASSPAEAPANAALASAPPGEQAAAAEGSLAGSTRRKASAPPRRAQR